MKELAGFKEVTPMIRYRIIEDDEGELFEFEVLEQHWGWGLPRWKVAVQINDYHLGLEFARHLTSPSRYDAQLVRILMSALFACTVLVAGCMILLGNESAWLLDLMKLTTLANGLWLVYIVLIVPLMRKPYGKRKKSGLK